MPALSPSRAADFMQCPLLYRFRAVDKLPEPATAAMARGTLVHAVLEHLFDAAPHERTREHAESLLGPAWEQMLTERPELADLIEGDDEVGLGRWFAAALALIDRWFTLEDPTRLEPAERELYVEADLDGLTLRGYVDRLDVAPDGRMRVVDYKTGRSPREAFEGKALFQMKFYALVLWKLTGRIPTRLQLVYLGNAQILTYDPQEQELEAVARKLTALWEAIAHCLDTGEFAATPSRLCDWCYHRDKCPAWGGTPEPISPQAVARALGTAVVSRPSPAAPEADPAGEPA